MRCSVEINSHLSFLRMMAWSMSNEQKMCKEKIFQLESNVIIFFDKHFAFKKSAVSVYLDDNLV